MALFMRGLCILCGQTMEVPGTGEMIVSCETQGCSGKVTLLKPEWSDPSKVTELPVGKYDAVRTLRQALQQAEDGKIKAVILICSSGLAMEDAADDGGHDIWATWSEMRRYEVLWLQHWFGSWLNKRYFGDYHADDEEEE